MKRIRLSINNLVKSLSVLGLLAAASIEESIHAADYAVEANFWIASSITNVATQTTNLNTQIQVTQFSDFGLEATLGFTNASAGTYDIAWSSSHDGINWADTGIGSIGCRGWFSIPLTNGGPVITWSTNITVNTCGYWRIEWGTNASVQHLTNAVIKGYVKPKRTNNDF